MCSSAAVMSSDSTARAGGGAGAGQGVQLPQQVGALPAEHGGQRRGVGGADGGHDLEEEVVAVAAGGDGWLGEPAVEFGAAGRGEAVDDAVGLDLLRLSLGLDQAVPGEPVEYLVQVADVQPAPLVADGLLEAAFQLVAVGGLAASRARTAWCRGMRLTLSLGNDLTSLLHCRYVRSEHSPSPRPAPAPGDRHGTRGVR